MEEEEVLAVESAGTTLGIQFIAGFAARQTIQLTAFQAEGEALTPLLQEGLPPICDEGILHAACMVVVGKSSRAITARPALLCAEVRLFVGTVVVAAMYERRCPQAIIFYAASVTPACAVTGYERQQSRFTHGGLLVLKLLAAEEEQH